MLFPHSSLVVPKLCGPIECTHVPGVPVPLSYCYHLRDVLPIPTNVSLNTLTYSGRAIDQLEVSPRLTNDSTKLPLQKLEGTEPGK